MTFESTNTESINTQYHYTGKSSLYKFSEEWNLNSYEFDIIKRIVRCRKKGQFKEDLTKTIDLINIYLTEHLDESK
tara:strand:- start:248 stop:475 length:228 start_codon:yes stop_codon:yes gene_type:complete